MNTLFMNLREICLEEVGCVVDDGADPVHAGRAHGPLHALLHDEEDVVKHTRRLLVRLHSVQLNRLKE